MQELEVRLKGVQMVLQEKVQQLKEQVGPPSAGATAHVAPAAPPFTPPVCLSGPQLAKNAKSSSLLKELYEENAQLMTALQVTEQRQKKAEKKNFLLEGKVGALNKLLREVVQVALAT